MSRDLRAIFRDLAEIDAQLDDVAKRSEPEGDVNTVAHAVHVLIDIVRELAERTR
jgi:hypothetical protein